MHDRRIDDQTLTFGNQGALFMNAMTWWDQETFSIWSQPWGSAIAGSLKDTALTLVPGAIVPWSTWLAEHPDTTVLTDDLEGGFRAGAVLPHDNFVIGVALEESATGYYFDKASELGVVNDHVGDSPIVVFADGETRDIKVYLAKSSDTTLTFAVDDDGRIVDEETGSVWDTTRGVAMDGDLRGSVLQQIPWVSSFDWAWEDFFPHTSFYQGEE